VIRRLIPALISAALLAGCGGGGGGSSTPTSAAMPATGTTGSLPLGKPVATATLTVKYSTGFQTATTSSTSRSSTSRRPAYVNSNSHYLDVWVVDGSSGQAMFHVVNTQSSGPNIQCCNGGGNQVFSIPLFSFENNYVVAFEADAPDGSAGNLLAIGEADIGTFSAGTAPQISLTMVMNAAHIGVMSDPDNNNEDATTVSPYQRAVPACTLGNTSGPLYFFVTDPIGGFIDTAGTGGVVLPTVNNWTSDTTAPTNTLTQGSGVAGTYSAAFANFTGGVKVNLTAPNPAYALAFDAYENQGPYPGLTFLYQANQDFQLNNYISTVAAAGPTISNAIDIVPDAAPCSSNFFYTGSQQSFTVPAGVTQVTVGANGASGSGATAGLGGSVTATIPVLPGQILNVYVGGIGGFNGSGASGGDGCGSPGGDASDVRQFGNGLAQRVVVAGGGGGGFCNNGFGGGNGGAGGGLTAAQGFNVNVGGNGGGFGGLGGTQAAGGAGGSAGIGAGNATAGGNGVLGFGGNGGAGDQSVGCTGIGGSGGGSGYYGGGGGGGGAADIGCVGGYGGGGGGGGSSYTEPSATNVTNSQGVWGGNGTVSISWL